MMDRVRRPIERRMPPSVWWLAEVKRMRILITGGAGFIGSHLCDRLLADGHEVIAMDNLSTGSTDNIVHLAGRDDFSFIKHDVTNYIYVPGPLDAVLHLASLPSPVDYLNKPIQTLKVGALGTHKTLGLCKEKGARFLLASTSEVYGDPQVHPQPETYWGHVNPVGPRGVYDESKRFAEAMAMAYHRYHGVETRIVRIFNSILADERVVLFNDERIHTESIGAYAEGLERGENISGTSIRVPAFDPETGTVALRPVSALIKHPCVTDAFEVTLQYGRKIRVTGDHSVFRQGQDGRPEAVPVRELCRGDRVAVPALLPVIEKDWPELSVADALVGSLPPEEWWHYWIVSPAIPDLIDAHRPALKEAVVNSGRTQVNRPWSASNIVSAYKRRCALPLYLVDKLNLRVPQDAEVRCQYSRVTVPNKIPITNDLLWLLGFTLAEGMSVKDGRGRWFLTFCSDERYLARAKTIIEDTFGTHVGQVPPGDRHSPSIYTHSRILYVLFVKVFGLAGLSTERRVPAWVLQLPLSRLTWFLEGYKDGDGTHSGKSVGNELCFNTSSPELADDLDLLLLRFGLVASHGHYETTYKEKYGDRKFPFQRLTLRGLSDYDILNWDSGVGQHLQSQRWGDLVWAVVRSVRPCVLTSHVYDLSVPGCENFLAGNGVFAHNTYGPRMRLDDGRVVPNFIKQALQGQPLTVYGDGLQTRSFCYVSDLVEGIVRLLMSDEVEPVNLGNPDEYTIRDFAEIVNELTGNQAGVTFIDRSTLSERVEDDPKVRRPDIAKAREILGWEPAYGLRAGLQKTIAYFRERVCQESP
jgi:UDP-glucuronate decarboxylase